MLGPLPYNSVGIYFLISSSFAVEGDLGTYSYISFLPFYIYSILSYCFLCIFTVSFYIWNDIGARKIFSLSGLLRQAVFCFDFVFVFLSFSTCCGQVYIGLMGEQKKLPHSNVGEKVGLAFRVVLGRQAVPLLMEGYSGSSLGIKNSRVWPGYHIFTWETSV